MLPPTKKKGTPLPPDDPINLALQQLEQYEEGTPKRSVKDYGNCCPCNHTQPKDEEDRYESESEDRQR